MVLASAEWCHLSFGAHLSQVLEARDGGEGELAGHLVACPSGMKERFTVKVCGYSSMFNMRRSCTPLPAWKTLA